MPPLFLRPVDPARAMLALPARAGWAVGTVFPVPAAPVPVAPVPVAAPLGTWSCTARCSMKTWLSLATFCLLLPQQRQTSYSLVHTIHSWGTCTQAQNW